MVAPTLAHSATPLKAATLLQWATPIDPRPSCFARALPSLYGSL